MIIPFKEEPETREGFPCTAFRWTFQIEKDFIGFIHQHHLGEGWHNSHNRVFQLWYHGEWRLGQDHFWYDGPHCQFAFGPFRIQWSNPSCKKCLGE